MQLFSLGVRGGIKKVNSAIFSKDAVYLIDDFKIMYLWFGDKIDKRRRDWLNFWEMIVVGFLRKIS